MSGNSRERSEAVANLGRSPDGEALQNIINKLLDVRNLKHLHLKHYHISTAQFKKRTTHLDIPGKVYAFYQHVVKTCPFCNSTKPRPDRSRMSGQCAEEFGDFIFSDHGSAKIGNQTFGFLVVLDGAASHSTAYPCKRIAPSEVTSKLHEWMDTFQMNPKAIFAYMAFHHPDFPQDRTLLVNIEPKWVSDYSRSFFRHSWIQPLTIWTRLLCHRSHLPS